MDSWFDFIPLGWATVAIAIGLVIFTLAYLQLGPVARLKVLTQKPLPETRIYTAKDLITYVPPVRDLYRRQLKWDMVFALVYTCGLFAVLDGTLGTALQSPSQRMWLAWIPVALGVVDLIEDALLLGVTSHAVGPGWEPPNWLWAAQTATVLKIVLTGFSLVLILAGAVALGLVGANSWTPPLIG